MSGIVPGGSLRFTKVSPQTLDEPCSKELFEKTYGKVCIWNSCSGRSSAEKTEASSIVELASVFYKR